MDRARWTSIGEVITLLVAFTVGVLGTMLVVVTVSPALKDAGITMCCLAVLSLLAGGAAALAKHRARQRDHRRRAE
jgi:uncharacterized membrane protein YqhA